MSATLQNRLFYSKYTALPVVKSRPVRVLIADDNEHMRDAIQRALKAMDVEICAVAANGTEAVEAAIAHKPDLLILDMVMPGLTGVEVAGIVKEQLPTSKVLLFTLYPEKVSEILRTFAGVDFIIEKSNGLSDLRTKIGAMIGESA